jgi:hypothetical protein
MIRFAQIKTPVGDEVEIVLHSERTRSGFRYVITVHDGPHDGEKATACNKGRAAELYEDQCRRHRTGLMRCSLCEGTGRIEFFEDIWTVAGHSTRESSELCDECDQTGSVEDVNLLP